MLDALSTLARRASVTWWDVIDILLVAILIYEFLKLIRGTRAVQMAVGSGLIVAAVLRLDDDAAADGELADPQHGAATSCSRPSCCSSRDIRRALAHFGRAPFFRAFTKPDTDAETIEEVVVAASYPGRRGGRARSSCSSARSACATTSRAASRSTREVTYDLLVSIFQPTAPLHDGAVIVQEGRIAAASCFLPLTVQPMLSRELGTRHRAAIGLTEENDAVAVVVSEETGQDLDCARRRHRARPRLRISCGRGCARSSSSGGRVGRSRAPSWRRRGRDGLSSVSPSRAEVPVDCAGRRDLADRRRSARRSSAACACRSSSTTCPTGSSWWPTRPTASKCGCAVPRAPSGGCCRARSWRCSTCRRRAPGTRLFHLLADEVRVPYGVQVSQVNPSAMPLTFEQSATQDRAGACRRSTASRRRAIRVGRITRRPRWSPSSVRPVTSST